MMEWIIDKLMYFIIIPITIILTIALIFVIFAVGHDYFYPPESFSLVKSEWSCTDSRNESYTTLMPVGKVMIPQVHTRTQCVQWSKK